MIEWLLMLGAGPLPVSDTIDVESLSVTIT